jgi:hypothetical protein
MIAKSNDEKRRDEVLKRLLEYAAEALKNSFDSQLVYGHALLRLRRRLARPPSRENIRGTRLAVTYCPF